MHTRSSDNWKTKSGTWDSLNVELIDFDEDYPNISNKITDINFNIVNCNDYKRVTQNSLISTFVDDYILERYWNNPSKYIAYFKEAKYVMTPDFSLLIGMPAPMQQWNVYRNRLVGYVWQSAGFDIIPTVAWSDKKSFSFCFNGIEQGSTVAVSSVGCKTKDNKSYFDAGFNEMKKALKPKYIIFQCPKNLKQYYLDDNIVFMDSFWDNKRK